MGAPDLVQIRKMNANRLCSTIDDAARWLAQRERLPYQDSMPALDWQDVQALKRAVENIETALRHDAGLDKKYRIKKAS